MHPVLHTLCGGDDWAGCLERLATEGERDDSAKNQGIDEGPWGTKMHIDYMLPSLCEQLAEPECHDYGKGASAIRCRWNKAGDERSLRPKCGLITEEHAPKDTNDRFYIWQGGLGPSFQTWQHEVVPRDVAT